MNNQMISKDDEELRRIVGSLRVRIKVIGCGGGGSNTVNRLLDAEISNVEFYALNTDAKHLLSVHAPNKLLIGKAATRGLGAGSIPEVGFKAAKENESEIRSFLAGANMVFITAGMGGGTGTGGAPFVAKLSRDSGALTVGVVTMPFTAEGALKRQNASWGIQQLTSVCDTTIVLQNDQLLKMVPNLPLEAAFRVVDEILVQTIRNITELITKPSLVNLSYSHIQTIFSRGGVALIGMGESDARDNRMEAAVNEAISSPLLGDLDLSDTKGAFVRIVGGPDISLSEAQSGIATITGKLNPMTQVIWGASVDPSIKDLVKVMVVVTGVKSHYLLGTHGAYAREKKKIQ